MQAFIRNKFRGRSKRNHLITVGTFVLVGFHEWEAPNFKHTDVLTVYSYEEVLYLKSLPQYNLASLDAELYNLNSSSKPSGSGGVGGVGGASAAGADIEFTNEDYELPPNKAAVMDGEMNCGGGPGAAADMDEDFDFDAI